MRVNPKPGLPENQTAKANPYAEFMSESERAKDFSEFASASFEQRLLAYTIDLLLLGIVSKILTAVLGAGSLATALTTQLTIFYFVVGHLKYQRTLGKHLLGLRAISTDPLRPLTASRLFLRDVIGRFFSAALLGLGYLLPLVTDERRALHDYFGGSRVVSLKPVRELPLFLQLARGLGSIAAIAGVLAGVFYYTIYYTTWPLERLQRSYYTKGVRLKGITGNITNGFMIKRIDWEEGGEKIELEDLFVDVDIDSSRLVNEDYHIRKLSVARAHMTLKRDTAPALAEEEAAPEAAPDRPARRRARLVVPRFRMDEFDLNNLRLNVEGREIDVRRFFVGGLVAQGAELRIGRVYVDSPDLAFSVAGVRLEGKVIQTDGPAQLLVRRGLFPEALKADLDLNLQITGEWPEVNVEANAFQQKVKLRRQAARAEMSLTEWSPGHYLRGYWPIHRLSLRFDGRGDWKTMFLTTPISGAMHLQHIPFRVSANQTLLTVMAQGLRFEHQRGAYVSHLAVQPALATRGGWLQVDSSLRMASAEEELAYLYYGQPDSGLDESRRNRIRADLRFFAEPLIRQEALGQLAGLAGGADGEPAEGPIPLSPNVQRAPSNEAETADAE